MTFYGYQRPDGRVGVRNKVLILPASVCASDTARIIAQQVDGAVHYVQTYYFLHQVWLHEEVHKADDKEQHRGYLLIVCKNTGAHQ